MTEVENLGHIFHFLIACKNRRGIGEMSEICLGQACAFSMHVLISDMLHLLETTALQYGDSGKENNRPNVILFDSVKIRKGLCEISQSVGQRRNVRYF